MDPDLELRCTDCITMQIECPMGYANYICVCPTCRADYVWVEPMCSPGPRLCKYCASEVEVVEERPTAPPEPD